MAPLGIEGLQADGDDTTATALVAGHSALHSRAEREVLGNPSAGALAAASGAIATAASLTDVLRSVTDADHRLLSAAARRRMRQRQWTTTGRDGGTSGYGTGLMLREIDGRDWVGHGGAWTGQATRTVVDAERDIAISVLTNAIDVFEPQDGDRVRITAATGMGSAHELAHAERDADGRVVRWRGAMHLDAVDAVPLEG